MAFSSGASSVREWNFAWRPPPRSPQGDLTPFAVDEGENPDGAGERVFGPPRGRSGLRKPSRQKYAQWQRDYGNLSLLADDSRRFQTPPQGLLYSRRGILRPERHAVGHGASCHAHQVDGTSRSDAASGDPGAGKNSCCVPGDSRAASRKRLT